MVSLLPILSGLVIIGVVITLVLYAFFKWKFQYWKRRGVPYFDPVIPYGTITGVPKRENLAVTMKRLYDAMKAKGWKHGGIYTTFSPAYLVIDLDYIKNIMTKDFQYFTDRGMYHNAQDDPLSAHLFNVDGPQWRHLRAKLTPTFSSGKMKMMFQTLVECEHSLQKRIELEIIGGQPIDIKEILGCFTTDIIGSCAFGLDCKTFEQDNSPFREYGKKVFERSNLRHLQVMFLTIFPELSRKLHLKLVPDNISNFFTTLVQDTLKYRQEKSIIRNDFLQLLMDLGKKEALEGQGLTFPEIAAQSFVFFIAGFETSSTAMTFALYLLSKNPDIQDKLREEINRVLAKHEGKITYEAIQEMKYLSQVLDETMRIFPPGPLVPRKCVKDYNIPGTDIVIEKDTNIFIPILAIHNDPEYYPEPEKFDPDRFSDENVSSRPNYTHIPFGEGPRICIGMRFGIMQAKVGLASLVKRFKWTVNDKTLEPLEMKPNSVVLAAEGEIWLNAERVND